LEGHGAPSGGFAPSGAGPVTAPVSSGSDEMGWREACAAPGRSHPKGMTCSACG
jgi:hypothetical protein